MNKRPEPTQQSLIDQWLAQGNTVTVCPPCEHTDPDEIEYTRRWGKRGPKKKKPVDK